jgi:hypothetical protein
MSGLRARAGPYTFTEAKLASWMKHGRGQGHGVDYQPWLTTRDVKSRGRKSRVRGNLHDRTVHLMSTHERNAFNYFEWRADVLDIREQFPLDREVTRRIAWSMGVAHPADPRSKVDIVMTTDLLVTIRRADGREVVRPLSIKPAAALLDRRTLDKQEIERRYWTRLGFRWQPLVDALFADKEFFEALRSIREWYHVDDVAGIDARAWEQRRRFVLNALASTGQATLGDIARDLEALGGFGPGEVLSTVKHLAARRLVGFDPRLGVPTSSCPVSRFPVAAKTLRAAA